MATDERRRRYETFESLAEWPMLILAVAIIPLILFEAIAEPEGWWRTLLNATNWVILGAFTIELLIKLYLAPARIECLRRNWLDAVIVVVLLVAQLPKSSQLAFLAPLRLLRSARALRLLRASRLASTAVRAAHTGTELLGPQGLSSVLFVATILLGVAAGGVYTFEHDAEGANITSFGDSLWWSAGTVTTVGYADLAPVTQTGKAIRLLLGFLGLAIAGLLTANLSAFLVRHAPKGTEPNMTDVMRELRDMEERLTRNSG